MKKFWLILYYGFARHLPDSYSRFWGSLSLKIRRLCCMHLFKMMGENVNIERGAWFGSGKDLEIGDNSGLGINCHVLNNTKIAKNVMMGPNCYMLESLHNYDRTDITMTEQGFTTNRCQVIIGDDLWIGRDVMIVGSKEIKTGSIVGARCLLTKSFPEDSVLGGNPSRLLKSKKL